jgi:hypothetical protein
MEELHTVDPREGLIIPFIGSESESYVRVFKIRQWCGRLIISCGVDTFF